MTTQAISASTRQIVRERLSCVMIRDRRANRSIPNHSLPGGQRPGARAGMTQTVVKVGALFERTLHRPPPSLDYRRR